jgi:hypothetical protein
MAASPRSTNALATIGDQQKKADEGIKALLGEEKFGQFEEYKKTMSERMQLNMFKTQLDGGSSPLQDDQFKRLMTLIADERAKNPPAFSQDSLPDPANLDKILNADVLDKQMQWQEGLNGRVLERAGQILTPEQLKAYDDFQKQQLNLQKFSMKMAREMFGNKPPIAEQPVQPPSPVEK